MFDSGKVAALTVLSQLTILGRVHIGLKSSLRVERKYPRHFSGHNFDGFAVLRAGGGGRGGDGVGPVVGLDVVDGGHAVGEGDVGPVAIVVLLLGGVLHVPEGGGGVRGGEEAEVSAVSGRVPPHVVLALLLSEPDGHGGLFPALKLCRLIELLLRSPDGGN